eukprot:15080_1
MGCCKLTGYCGLFVVLLAIAFQLYLLYGDQREFNRNTTTDVAATDIDLTGKTIVVTGASAGIGIPTTRVLLSHGATIIMACRNKTKATNAKMQIIKDLTSKKYINFKNYNKAQLLINIDIMIVDLSSLKSIKTFANAFIKKYERLNYLVLNAGVFGFPQFTPTFDGIESQFGINHIGHYYMTKLLTPMLVKTASNSDNISRVISVSSEGHKNTYNNMRLWLINDNMIQNKSEYSWFWGYGFSKACNILFAKEYNKRYSKQNVYAMSLHPGEIYTELGRHAMVINPTVTAILQEMIQIVFATVWQTADQGAATTIRTLSITDNEFKRYAGSYWKYCNVANEKLSIDMLDEKYPPMLWDLSEKMINERHF